MQDQTALALTLSSIGKKMLSFSLVAAECGVIYGVLLLSLMVAVIVKSRAVLFIVDLVRSISSTEESY